VAQVVAERLGRFSRRRADKVLAVNILTLKLNYRAVKRGGEQGGVAPAPRLPYG
jgi:hypothetical protein